MICVHFSLAFFSFSEEEEKKEAFRSALSDSRCSLPPARGRRGAFRLSAAAREKHQQAREREREREGVRLAARRRHRRRFADDERRRKKGAEKKKSTLSLCRLNVERQQDLLRRGGASQKRAACCWRLFVLNRGDSAEREKEKLDFDERATDARSFFFFPLTKPQPRPPPLSFFSLRFQQNTDGLHGRGHHSHDRAQLLAPCCDGRLHPVHRGEKRKGRGGIGKRVLSDFSCQFFHLVSSHIFLSLFSPLHPTFSFTKHPRAPSDPSLPTSPSTSRSGSPWPSTA